MSDQDQLSLRPSRRFATLLVATWLAAATIGCSGNDATRRSAPDLESDDAEITLFVDQTEPAGVNFHHLDGRAGSYAFPEIMAAGGALLDYDQDGDLDIYLTNAAAASFDQSPAGAAEPRGRNRLFRQDAPGRFSDVTSASGLGDAGFGMGVAVGDVNNDGYPDVYVTNYGADRLYLNQRNGAFVDATREAGIDNLRWGTSASFVDYDRDGWLDLFVTNYVDYFPGKQCFDPRGKEDYCGPQAFAGTADQLYRNVTAAGAAGENHGTAAVRFADVSLEAGVSEKPGPGLGVLCADFNGDHWPDIFVANDGTANFLWINNRDGSFREEAVLWGCAYEERGLAQGCMGVALGDCDGDGANELFVTNLAGETNSLYRYLRSATGFHDAAAAAGLAASSFPYTGFGTALVDLDHDGDLDLLVANGRVKRPLQGVVHPGGGQGGPSFWSIYAERNQVFLNDGQGRFQGVASSPDGFLAPVEVSRGLAVGDVDQDGDWDLLVTNVAGPARLLINEAEKRGTWLVVRAVDPRWGGRDAYGAAVTVTANSRRWQRLVQPGFSYLSSSDPCVHFGLGDTQSVDRIEVLWPDGAAEAFPGGSVNRRLVLSRGGGQLLADRTTAAGG